MKQIFPFIFSLFLFACQKELSQEGFTSNNKPPVANAGLDISLLLPLDSVSLVGTASSDPDGFITQWSWTKISGPSSFAITAPGTSVTMLRNLIAGVYEFELKVTDNQGAFSKDTVQIIVSSSTISNRPPVANAGTDQTITLPLNSVIVDGTGSTDPDNNITQWKWSKISGPASFQIDNDNAAQTTILNLIQGVYQFEFKVTDAGGLYSKDTLFIIVTHVQQQIGNLVFFFPDPTGSVAASYTYIIPTNPTIALVIVKITNYPDGIIGGVWCHTCSPRCPISSDYSAEEGNYTSFTLPPGTYSWTAESVVTSFNGYPLIPEAFKNFMALPHTTQGTVTISSGDDCVIKKIVF